MNIGIVVLATNTYFPLGIRFIKRFFHYYKGQCDITFYFFSDTDPSEYVQNDIDIVYFETSNKNWVDGTNLKFTSILSIGDKLKSDYLFYFDADTNVGIEFDESWFLGDMVAGQHYADQDWMKQTKGFDRHEGYNAYVPYDTELPQMYYYGAFFGGTSENCIQFCNILRQWQVEDQSKGFEPDVNDESYINKYFHYNPPTRIVMANEYEFCVSDKGGLEDIRNSSLDISEHKNNLIKYRDSLIRIENGQVLPVLPT
jgi:N-acetyllactosaminide 3-alpha-galactosyltransferase